MSQENQNISKNSLFGNTTQDNSNLSTQNEANKAGKVKP